MNASLPEFLPALRSLIKSPAFALTTVVSLALGIGACAVTFSVVNGVLLRPLPYLDPDRLVFVMSDLRARNVEDFPLSHADFIDLRADSTSTFRDPSSTAKAPPVLTWRCLALLVFPHTSVPNG